MSIAQIVFLIVIPVLAWFIFIHPVWNVWRSKKRGEAELEEANFAEQVAIANARARKGAAEMNKAAEIVEAEAVAISVKTIGTALQENPSYNVWQWIKMMDKDNNKSTIYVPTEANLPILEASRLTPKPKEE